MSKDTTSVKTEVLDETALAALAHNIEASGKEAGGPGHERTAAGKVEKAASTSLSPVQGNVGTSHDPHGAPDTYEPVFGSRRMQLEGAIDNAAAALWRGLEQTSKPVADLVKLICDFMLEYKPSMGDVAKLLVRTAPVAHAGRLKIVRTYDKEGNVVESPKPAKANAYRQIAQRWYHLARYQLALGHPTFLRKGETACKTVSHAGVTYTSPLDMLTGEGTDGDGRAYHGAPVPLTSVYNAWSGAIRGPQVLDLTKFVPDDSKDIAGAARAAAGNLKVTLRGRSESGEWRRASFKAVEKTPLAVGAVLGILDGLATGVTFNMNQLKQIESALNKRRPETKLIKPAPVAEALSTETH